MPSVFSHDQMPTHTEYSQKTCFIQGYGGGAQAIFHDWSWSRSQKFLVGRAGA